MESSSLNQNNDAQKNTHPERPYEKPAVVWEQSIDIRTLALQCGKNDPGLETCQSGTPGS